jgi:integrase
MNPAPLTLKEAIDHYTLYRQLAPQTIAWYSRAVSVYCHWARGDVPLSEFNGEAISRMLVAKEAEGRSLYYLKSLRGGLVSLLRHLRGGAAIEQVRSIRPPPLDPIALTPQEVERLLAACQTLPPENRWRYVLMISIGYYTGLDAADIWRLERRHFATNGSLFFRRGKTGAAIFVRVPDDVIAVIDKHCQRHGPLIQMGVSKERFRQIIAQLFTSAGLCGSFKTLRKSAGSLVEQQQPGAGHRHLGNTRGIFEKHYEAHRITRTEPTMPPPVKLPLCGGGANDERTPAA